MNEKDVLRIQSLIQNTKLRLINKNYPHRVFFFYIRFFFQTIENNQFNFIK